MLLPKPYPDELVGSILMRGSRWTGLTFHRLLEHLAGERVTSHSMLMPSYPGIARACGLAPEALIKHHSLFPYAVAFLPVAVREAALHSFAGTGRQAAAGSRVQKVVRDARLLKFCSECVSEDVQVFGESYWHCLHQIDGYLFCVKHACGLRVAPLALRTRQQVLPSEVRSISRSIVVDANPMTVALLSARVRDSFYWRHELPADLQVFYFKAAGCLGYQLSSRRILSRAFSSDVQRYFGRELLDFLGCGTVADVVSWPGHMLRRHPGQFAPIRHVVLRQFLEDVVHLPPARRNF